MQVFASQEQIAERALSYVECSLSSILNQTHAGESEYNHWSSAVKLGELLTELRYLRSLVTFTNKSEGTQSKDWENLA